MDTDINYIILESIKGDKKYQEILLKRLHPLLYKNIYKYYEPNSFIIEDLVQEGYIVILKSLKSYNENLNVHFLGYIKTKLFYFYKNYYRNTKNQRDTVGLNQSIGDKKNNHVSDPLEEILKNDEINELFSNINKLSVKEQKLLYMFYMEGLSLIDISNKLNIPYGTVVWRKYNSLQKLRNLIGGEKDGRYFRSNS